MELLNLKNTIVTADAIHTQKETTKLIIEKDGDYILQVKENQKDLYNAIATYFDKKLADNNSKNDYETYTTTEKNGGRIETRKLMKLKDIEYIINNFKGWQGLKSIFCIERKIEEKEKTSIEKSYYISGLEDEPEKLLKYARNHWKIESYHWILDVNYKEDFCKVRNENAQRVLNSFRKISIKLHKEYIERNNPKRKTIISSIRNCLTSNKKLEEFLDDIK